MAVFIAAQRADHGIPEAVSCRALGVSQSWFYKWRRGDASPRRARRERLKAEIARLFARRKGRDGSPPITAALNEAGRRVSKNTVAALMRSAARPKKARKGTTRPGRAAGAPRTWSGATSARKRSTRSGMATALRSPRARASSSWTACWTWARAGSSGLPWASITTPSWPTGRWPWRWRCAAARCPASSCTPIRAASTPRAGSGRPASGFPSPSPWAGPGRRWITRSSSPGTSHHGVRAPVTGEVRHEGAGAGRGLLPGSRNTTTTAGTRRWAWSARGLRAVPNGKDAA